jgi:hypothetical protein
MNNKNKVIKMKLKCKNMTHAMKANRLLYDNGIRSRVEKISDDPDIHGCVYSIAIDDSLVRRALKIMSDGGVQLHKKEKIRYGDDA